MAGREAELAAMHVQRAEFGAAVQLEEYFARDEDLAKSNAHFRHWFVCHLR